MNYPWWRYGYQSENDSHFGYCSNVDEAINVLHAFEEATSTKFVALRNEQNFGAMDITARNHFVMFEGRLSKDDKSIIPFCGQPFLVLSQRIYECRSGINPETLQKQEEIPEKNVNEASLKKNVSSPIKCTCPAKVVMKEVVLFPDYFIKENIDSRKKKVSKKLKDALKTSVEIQAEQRIYISLPTEERHKNHICVEVNGVEVKKEKPTDSIMQMMRQNLAQKQPAVPVWPTYEVLNQAMQLNREMDDSNFRIFSSETEVWNYIEELQTETCTKYVCHTKDKCFGDKNWKPDPSNRVYWRHPVSSPVSIEFDGFPFMFVGRRILFCHQGPDQALSKKRKRAEMLKQMDKSPMRRIDSKKLGCKAHIYISHIAKFPGFEIVKDTAKRRKLAASRLKEAIKTGDIEFKSVFLVSTPSTAEHEGHLLDISSNVKRKKPSEHEVKQVSEHISSFISHQASEEVVVKEDTKDAEVEADDPETRKMELCFQCDVKIDAIREMLGNVHDETCLTDLLVNLEAVYARSLLYPAGVESQEDLPKNATWVMNGIEDVYDIGLPAQDDDGLATEASLERNSVCEVHIDVDS